MKTKRKHFHSYTFRLALLYALTFSASTLILFYFFYLFTASYMSQQMDNTIEAEIQGLAEHYDRAGLEGLTRLIAQRVSRAQGTGNSLYLLVNYTLAPVVGNLDRWPRDALVVDDKWLEFTLEVDETTNETHLARARFFRLPGQYGLLVGRDIHQQTQAKRRIIQALTWGLAIMVLLAFAGGLVLSRHTVRTIERINQTARSIMSGNLSRRVAISNRNDDFDQLAANLNAMLDRIQTLMEDIRRVSDNIAHDLRTPLTRLIQHIEEAHRQTKEDSTAVASLEGAIREADSLLTTFNALLRIARIEAGQLTTDFSTLDLRTLIEDVVEFYEPLAEDRHQQLTVDPGTTLRTMGDRDLLFQALANIIENAIKYTPRDGQITVSLTHRANEAVITIADNGPGIPVEEREKVFRRFYRLDRSRTTAGNGLGLSMVSAVVIMHGGEIQLMENDPGLRTVMRLPLRDDTARLSPQLADAPATHPHDSLQTS